MTTENITPLKKPEGPMPRPTHPDYPASGVTNWAFWFPREQAEKKEGEEK